MGCLAIITTAVLGSDVRTVRQLTGETPDAQSIQNVTGTVTEERQVEETPLNTWEQVVRIDSLWMIAYGLNPRDPCEQIAWLAK